MTLEQAVKEVKEHHELNYDDDDYNDNDAIEDLMDECGQNSEGYCELAGTEYCDWDCPFSE